MPMSWRLLQLRPACLISIPPHRTPQSDKRRAARPANSDSSGPPADHSLRHESSALSNETNAALLAGSRQQSTAGYLAQRSSHAGEPAYAPALAGPPNFGHAAPPPSQPLHRSLGGSGGHAPSNLGPPMQSPGPQHQYHPAAYQQHYATDAPPYSSDAPPSGPSSRAAAPKMKLQLARSGPAARGSPSSNSPLAKLHSPSKSGTGKPRGRPPKHKNVISVLEEEASAAAAAATASGSTGHNGPQHPQHGAHMPHPQHQQHGHELANGGMLHALHAQLGHLGDVDPDHLEPLQELPMDPLDAALGQGLGAHFGNHSEQW
jgi:hypothetical protein